LERLTPETKDNVKEELEKVFSGEFRNFEVEFDKRAYSLSAVPLTNDAGEIDEILVVEKNITAQREMANKLEQNLIKERDLNEMKSRFVSMASHEFSTPLTTINSSASLILKYHEKETYEKLDKHVSRIKNAVRNLTSILNDFLSLEKLESGNITATFQKQNLSQLIDEILDEMSGNLKKGQKLINHFKSGFLFNTDAQLFRNIIINLISNAIKYSGENDVIEVDIDDQKYSIVISVKDHGIGIPEKDQERMFSRFFRAVNVINIEGTGLVINIF
jgi:signal transduction histidine kinase